MHVHFKVHGTGKKNLHGDGIALWYTRDRLVPGEEVHGGVGTGVAAGPSPWVGGCSCWPVTSGGWTWQVACLWLLCTSVGRLLLTWLWRGRESLWCSPLHPSYSACLLFLGF